MKRDRGRLHNNRFANVSFFTSTMSDEPELTRIILKDATRGVKSNTFTIHLLDKDI